MGPLCRGEVDTLKILFLFPYKQSYTSQSVREQPCGGTEKTAIYLGEAFQKLGHSVHWVTTLDELEASLQFDPDVVITQLANFMEVFPKAYKVWWVHQFADQSLIRNHVAAARQYANQIVTLSQAQADNFQTELNLPSTIIGHGVWREECQAEAVQKDPFRFLYCSAPERGLALVEKIFPLIQAHEPRATLTICCAPGVYATPEETQDIHSLFERLMAMPGIHLTGPLPQSGLYQEMARARYFFYPCSYAETYCLSLDEALAHDCWPLVMEIGVRGALMERVRIFQISELSEMITTVQQAKPPEGPLFEPKDWLEIGTLWQNHVLKGSTLTNIQSAQ